MKIYGKDGRVIAVSYDEDHAWLIKQFQILQQLKDSSFQDTKL